MDLTVAPGMALAGARCVSTGSPETKVIVDGLSKGFLLHKRKSPLAGVTTDSLAGVLALSRYLVRGGSAVEAGGDSASADVFYALKDVSFTVPAGEVLGIIGRNGAGKSTLLKILARTLEPSAGRVTLRGRVVSLLELGIGFAPDLTVRENIQIYGRLAGFPAAAVTAAEERILAFAQLEKYRNTLLELCPSGSFVQLAFSAMINLQADIVLADEVLTVGDSEFRKRCEERIRAVGQSGEAVLFVSHDMEAIRRCCSRVLWIDKGRVHMSGPTDEVVSAYIRDLLAGRLVETDPEGDNGPCTLIDLRLLDAERSQTGAFQITKSGFVECIVRVLRPDTAVFVEMQLWHGKIHVFTGRAHEPLRAMRPTTFRVGFEIPAEFLNETSYQLRARLLIPDFSTPEGELVEHAQEQLEFTAFNADPDASVWCDWEWSRRGIVSPRLEWTVSERPPATS